MRFVVVTSLMTVTLIVFVSAISIAVLSWAHSGRPMYKKMPEPKIEIKWGEGS
jgi:hypothetical protein